MIEIERRSVSNIIKETRYFEPYDNVLIYSINSNAILEEISKVIDLIISKKAIKILSKFGIRMFELPKKKSSTNLVGSYEILINGKKYSINKFCLDSNTNPPPMLFSAYLNVNNTFRSVGYICYTKNLTYIEDHLFISVQECLDFSFSTDDLDEFKNNEVQSIYFIIDLLKLINTLNSYRIKLLDSKIIFSADKSFNEWRFRVDDICGFHYVNPGELLDNSMIITKVVDRFLKILKRKSIFNFFQKFNNLCKEVISNDYFYIEILIEVSKNQLKNVQDTD